MGHKQTLKLLKVHVEVVENYTFKAKLPILAISGKMPTCRGTNCCIDLYSASIYSEVKKVLIKTYPVTHI